jgi:hypothetical protein
MADPKAIKAEHAPNASQLRRGRRPVYPWGDLEVGGCFEIPAGKRNSLRNAVNYRNRTYPQQFEIRQDEDNGKFYVFRIK